MKSVFRFSEIIAVGVIMLAAASVSATESVSPGALDRLAQVNNACPTFSWGMNGDAVAYDVVAYLLPEDASQSAELTADTEVLFTRVAGSATSWTPSAEQCFAPGGRYVWFVRAVNELAGDEVVAASEWSAGRYFTVPAAPSVDEVARALEVLQRYVAQGGDAQVLASTAAPASGGNPNAPLKGGDVGGPKSVTTASAAIRGSNPEYDVEAYGLVGVTNSVYGAGVGAANTEGGPDLLLDGSYDGGTNTSVYEWGIDRSSSSDETFWVRNTGGGAITLDVFGTLRGTALDCPDCVGPTDLASESVTGDAIEDGGVAEADIAADAVTTAHILDGTIQAGDLAADAISGAAITDGSITTADLADGAVTGAKIGAGAVHTINIADESVGSAQIEYGGVGTDNIDFSAVTSSRIADGTIVSADLADESVTSAKIEFGAIQTVHFDSGAVNSAAILDGTIRSGDLGDGSITSAKILNGTITAADMAPESVGSNAIEDGGVSTADIDASAVGTAQLADGAVTAAKLAPGAIGAGSLADGSVTSATIANFTIAAVDLADGAVTASKLGDGSVQSAKLGPGAVTTDKLHDAAVSNAKLAMNSVTASRILDGSIVGADLADGAVSATKLGLNSVTGAHIVDGAVTGMDVAAQAIQSVHIENGTISGEDIRDGAIGAAKLGDGLYANKGDLYMVWETVPTEAHDWVSAIAECHDENDIAIAASCHSDVRSPYLTIEPPFLAFWEDGSLPAAVGCWYFKDTEYVIAEGMAIIYCVDVP